MKTSDDITAWRTAGSGSFANGNSAGSVVLDDILSYLGVAYI